MTQALVSTLRDILSAFPKALSSIPSTPESMKAQRALGVLIRALDELYETM